MIKNKIYDFTKILHNFVPVGIIFSFQKDNKSSKKGPPPPEKILKEFCVFGREKSLSERRNDSVKRANAVKVILSALNAIFFGLKLFTNRSKVRQRELKVRQFEAKLIQHDAKVRQRGLCGRQHELKVRQPDTKVRQHNLCGRQHNAKLRQPDLCGRQHNAKLRQFISKIINHDKGGYCVLQ